MEYLRLKKILEQLKKEGIHLTKRTFEFYQKLGLLPKPLAKEKGKSGGVYGLYSPSVIEDVKFIEELKADGSTLSKIREVATGDVIEKYKAILKEWGFSDYSLSELKGLSPKKTQKADEYVTSLTVQLLKKQYKEETGKKFSPEWRSFLLKYERFSPKFEKKIIEDLGAFAYSTQIEAHALDYIHNYAFEQIGGLSTALIFASDEMDKMITQKQKNRSLIKLYKKITLQLLKMEVVTAKTGIRLAEILGEYKGRNKESYERNYKESQAILKKIS